MIIYISEQFKKKINILIFPFSPVTLIIPEEILHYNTVVRLLTEPKGNKSKSPILTGLLSLLLLHLFPLPPSLVTHPFCEDQLTCPRCVAASRNGSSVWVCKSVSKLQHAIGTQAGSKEMSAFKFVVLHLTHSLAGTILLSQECYITSRGSLAVLKRKKVSCKVVMESKP